MDALSLLLHVANFLAPAAVVAALLSFSGIRFSSDRPLASVTLTHMAIIFLSCLCVLLAGVVLTGHDGRMAVYVLMVLAAGTTRWVIGLWEVRRRGSA